MKTTEAGGSRKMYKKLIYGGEEKEVVMDYLPNLKAECLIDKRRKIIRNI